MRRTPETACWLRLGCWSNNIANSHHSPGAFNRKVRSCLVPQCLLPPIDPSINNALRIATGCLHPTPADNLPILADIQPAELRHNGATLSLACFAMEPRHLLHSALTCTPSANAQCLKLRCTVPPRLTLPRTAWVWLNHLRTSVRRFHSCLFR